MLKYSKITVWEQWILILSFEISGVEKMFELHAQIRFALEMEKFRSNYRWLNFLDLILFHLPRSSTCPLTSFFWLLSHVIYLKLTRVLYECLLSQIWVMGSITSFSVSQQLRSELSAKWMLSILSNLPLTKKTEKTVYFSIL